MAATLATTAARCASRRFVALRLPRAWMAGAAVDHALHTAMTMSSTSMAADSFVSPVAEHNALALAR